MENFFSRKKKIPMLLREGFWKAAHEARVDYAMFLGLWFLVLVGGGAFSIDAARSKGAD